MQIWNTYSDAKPLSVIVTTRIIISLVVDPYKPSVGIFTGRGRILIHMYVYIYMYTFMINK